MSGIGEVAGALADARRAAHGARAEALERRPLVGGDGVRSAARRRSARGCARRWRRPTRAACSSRARRARGVSARIARASSTDLPRMWSQTRRALRAEVRTYLACARTSGARARRDGARGRGGAAAGASASALARERRRGLGFSSAAGPPRPPPPRRPRPRRPRPRRASVEDVGLLGLLGGRVRGRLVGGASARARRSRRASGSRRLLDLGVLGRLVAHRRFPVSAWPR